MRRAPSCLLACVTALVVSSLPPAPASAAVSCQLTTATGTLRISLTEAGDVAQIRPPNQRQGQIEINDVACSGGSPTVTNVDLIRVSDSSGGSTAVELYDAEDLGPGRTEAGADEGPASDEIELELNLGQGRRDRFSLRSFVGIDAWRYGSLGINYNVEAGPADDVDVWHRGVEEHAAAPGIGDNIVDARGGAATGSSFSLSLTIYGGFGDDELFGGTSRDFLYGSFGSENLRGGPGHDYLEGEDDPDLISGGAGVDTASWGGSGEARVDIGAGGANDGRERDESASGELRDRVLGNIENLNGSFDDDVLIGDAGPNRLFGDDRQDLLIGLGGDDTLVDARENEAESDVFRAGGGDDVIESQDRRRDAEIDCGRGRDLLRRDVVDPRGSRCEARQTDHF